MARRKKYNYVSTKEITGADIRQYNSVAEFNDAIKEENLKWKYASMKEYTPKRLDNFCHVKTREIANNLLLRGDIDNAMKIKAEGDIIDATLKGGKPSIETAVVGCVPNVPNYLRSVPKNMMRVITKPKKVHVIRIYVDSNIPFTFEARELAIAGAKIANVIAATERAGVRVELYVGNILIDNIGKKYVGFQLKVKDADAPLNLLNVAFPLIHPAFFRCLSLLHFETLAKEQYGHGTCVDINTIRSHNLIPNSCVLSLWEIARNNLKIEDLTNRINEHIKNMMSSH